MKKNKRINNKGFSLMELIVCLAISGFVILAAYSLVMVGTKSYDTNSKTTSLQQEVSYTNNLIGEAIRSAVQEHTKIITYTDSTTNEVKAVEIHTNVTNDDSKVICYNASEKKIYVYEQGESPYTAEPEEHLITKYVTDFNVDFVFSDSVEDETRVKDDATQVMHLSGSNVNIISAYSNLVKLTITFEYKGKTDKSEVIYQIRNKS